MHADKIMNIIFVQLQFYVRAHVIPIIRSDALGSRRKKEKRGRGLDGTTSDVARLP